MQKYKLIFITEDNIEYYGDLKENNTHSVYLAEYIDKYFKSHPYLGKLSEKYGAESLCYALTYFEHMIIILNETKVGMDGNPKYGTFACLELPPEISPKLQEKLLSLSNELSCFTQLYVEKSIVVDNYLESELIDVDDNLEINDKLLQIIEKVNNNIRRK